MGLSPPADNAFFFRFLFFVFFIVFFFNISILLFSVFKEIRYWTFFKHFISILLGLNADLNKTICAEYKEFILLFCGALEVISFKLADCSKF